MNKQLIFISARQCGKTNLTFQSFLASLPICECVLCYQPFSINEPTRGGVHSRLCKDCSEILFRDRGNLLERVRQRIKIFTKLNSI